MYVKKDGESYAMLNTLKRKQRKLIIGTKDGTNK